MNLDDLPDDSCEWCGTELPPTRPNYCSAWCAHKHRHAMEREARREARAGRTCLGCGGAIPLWRRTSAIYCTPECQRRHRHAAKSERRRQARTGRTCAECGEAIPENRDAKAIYCSRRCCNRRLGRRWARAKRRRNCAS